METKKSSIKGYVIMAVISCVISLIYHFIYYTDMYKINNIAMITNITILLIYLGYAIYLWIYYRKYTLSRRFLIAIVIINIFLIIPMAPFVFIYGIKSESIAILSNVNTVTILMYICIRFRRHQIIKFKR